MQFEIGDVFKYPSLTEDILVKLPKSHKEAKSSNLQFYYHGKKCRRGHIGIFQTNGGCLECRLERQPSSKFSPNQRRERIEKSIIQNIFFKIPPIKSLFPDSLLELPTSQKEAKERGESFYFPRLPCINHGHISLFTTISRNCVNCQETWKLENEDAISKSFRESEKRNREKRNEQRKLRRRKSQFKEARNAQRRERYAKDANYKIEQSLRARISKFISGERKTHSTQELLGANIDKIRKHLEEKFTDGMTWENHGEWHIDHIKPCANFDLQDSKQQKECFHYLNLQPLWAIDNLRKSNKT